MKCVAEMKVHVIKLEQVRNKLVLQTATTVDVVRLPNPTPNVSQLPLSAERLEKLK